MGTGKVFIVGAGPGDPQLITVRGHNALKQADVILYDRLVHPDLVIHAREDAERIYVGKQAGTPGGTNQLHINQLLIEHASKGKVVVRLKGGDPFVYGRGGEEALALSAAGIPFEIIPGVSAAVSVPEAALIPVTHRGIASAFAVFAGHGASDSDECCIDWEIAARIPTAIFLMGVERLPQIVGELLAHGRNANTPIAVIERGTLMQQRIFTGTLRNIITRATEAQTPATIVIGEVVDIRDKILSNIALCEESHRPIQMEREAQNDSPVDTAARRQIVELIGRL